MTFQFNDRVVVDGRQGRFIEYTPNGSARVFLNERDDLLVSPDSVSRPRSACTLPLDDGDIFNEELQTEEKETPSHNHDDIAYHEDCAACLVEEETGVHIL